MVIVDEKRRARGVVIAKMENEIMKVTENEYWVNSQSGKGTYSVRQSGKDWSCTCPDYLYNEVTCKHILCSLDTTGNKSRSQRNCHD